MKSLGNLEYVSAVVAAPAPKILKNIGKDEKM